jgi:hypothetical protein
VAPRPCLPYRILGTFSHIMFNGFWTCVVSFHPQRCPHTSVRANTSNWHLWGLKCCTRTLFCHSRSGTFSHIIFNGFWTCVVAFAPQRCPHTSDGANTNSWHLWGMKYCTRTVFCHSGSGHFFSYNLQWLLDLLFGIPSGEVPIY